MVTLAPELAGLGTEERRERVVEEVDDGLRLLGVDAAEPGRDRLVVRQVRHEPIGRSAAATAAAAAGARCRRGGRRSEGGGERRWGRGFRSGRGGGFGDVALVLLLLPRPGVGMAAVVGGL